MKKVVSQNSGWVVGMWWKSKMIEHNQNNVKNPLKVPFWNPLISLPSFWYCSTGIINKSFMPCANCKNECIGPTPPKMAGIWFCLMSANQSVTKRVINLSKPKKRTILIQEDLQKPIHTERVRLEKSNVPMDPHKIT